MTFWEYLNRREQRKSALMGQKRTSGWRDFWYRILSPQTARFVLALLSLTASTGAAFYLMERRIEVELKDVVVFAIGQMFALTAMAFGYYFGSTARNDERPTDVKVTNKTDEAVPTTEGEHA